MIGRTIATYGISPLWVTLATVVAAPAIGGLLTGIDRKLTARLQNRVGPPIWQPFHDLVKLWSKERITVNQVQLLYVYAHLFLMIASLVGLMLGQDLLMIFFIFAFSSVSLILGGFSVRSPYSRIGSQREIMQLMAYEPVLVLMAIGIYLATGSFFVHEIITSGNPLLYSLPLVFAAYAVILVVKLRKSPFDLSTAVHHVHQEVVKGLLTEYSGPYLGLIELANWYELVFLLALGGLFWATSLWGALLAAAVLFLFQVVVDTVSARVTWAWMLKFVWTVGLGLAAINIVWLYM
ncbi:MAG: NADH-quinone oxidoreductase subunit H [Firmicutes bacterium]|nr:NADH-quinone oxidoreductase subunit H [Bacillota bacterium]